MKYLSVTLLLFLYSCNGITPATHIDVERCFTSLEREVIIGETKLYAGTCICHTYRVGDVIGRITESEEKPLLYCDKIGGIKNYATTLYLYLEEWRIYLLQQKTK